MGQRHQVYVRVPAKLYPDVNGKPNCNNRPEKTIGIHHQWLFGKTAVRLLGNSLKFFKGQLGEEYNEVNSAAQNMLEGLYSLDLETAYYNRVHKLDAECSDPRTGDNNDGITVIDLSGPVPSYCFVSLDGLECAQEAREGVQDLVPMSAQEYLLAYYPDYKWRGEVNKEHEAECRELLNRVEGFKVMSKARLYKIFPTLKPKTGKK